MNIKDEWVKKMKEQGFDAHLDNQNVIMLETDNKEEAIRYREAMSEYPYSWGIKKKGDVNDEDKVLQDIEED